MMIRSRVSVIPFLPRFPSAVLNDQGRKDVPGPGLETPRRGIWEGMAPTLTWERLRDLATFRASEGRAVSLYVGLDPHEVPIDQVLEARVKVLLHGARGAEQGDIEWIRRWFHDEFVRANGVRAVAVFAAGRDNFWETLELSEPVADEVEVGPQLYLTPLARLLDHGDGTLVAFVGRERGQVFRLEGRTLAELADETSDAPGRHDQGGWSQANYERHIDTIVERHLRDVADTLEQRVRRQRGARVVLVGTEDVRSEFEELLSHEVRSRIIGRTS